MDVTFLKKLLSAPTAPYREAAVVRTLLAYFQKHRVPHFIDPIGNVVVGASSPADYRRRLSKNPAEPTRIVIAHMDHPGFHVVGRLGPRRLRVKWHGGSPTRHLNGAPVWLSDGERNRTGKMVRAKLIKSGHALESAEILLEEKLEGEIAGFFGGFKFKAPVWAQGSRWFTKAADDLVGVGVIASLAAALAEKRVKGIPFIGVLTRAEEVGFIGAIGHFELGWIPKSAEVVAVSLETSRTLPGALIGKGPVVRLGDRATVFDAGGLRVLTALANEVLPKKHQRRIMDGGTCEATAATAYGLRAIGISVPLGNYHNQSFEGGGGSRGPRGPAPEFVDIGDVKGMYRLVEALLRRGLPWAKPWESRREEFGGWTRAAANLLAGGRV